jgi:hypothetical protein
MVSPAYRCAAVSSWGRSRDAKCAAKYNVSKELERRHINSRKLNVIINSIGALERVYNKTVEMNMLGSLLCRTSVSENLCGGCEELSLKMYAKCIGHQVRRPISVVKIDGTWRTFLPETYAPGWDIQPILGPNPYA